jgi:hypothetical protein
MQVSPGQPVNFNVIAADPDADPLAYAWDFGEPPVWTISGLNSPNAVKSWSTPGQYRITATVSDMKGATASSSLLVTVGSTAATNQVWGRALWAGQPLFHARVWTTNGSNLYQAWTDTDGSYVLAGLNISNSYSLNCRGDGLTFTPQFSNPVTLTSSGITYGKDFFANELLPWGRGTTFSLSGRVAYGGAGVPHVEIRADGLITTTDLSGYYQFTNLPAGAYILTPAKENWQFSPASIPVNISSIDSTSNNFTRLAPYTISGSIDGIPAAPDDWGPTIYLSNGRSTDATLSGWPTNAHWKYSLADVPPGQYSISAFLWSYRFDPANFTNLLSVAGNLTNVNLVGSHALTFGSIVGRITEQSLPLPGIPVTATLDNTNAGFGITDSDGYYSIDNLGDGTFSVVPTASGYTFSPGSLADVYAGTSDNDFAAGGASLPPQISLLNATPVIVPNAASNAALSMMATGNGPLLYDWALVTGNAPVSFSLNHATNAASTVVSFQAPGVYLFRARVTDTFGFSATSNLNLTVTPLPATMVVAPYQVHVPKGSSIAFRASAWDQLGGSIGISPAWSVTGGGTINTDGVFSATAAGPCQIVGFSGALSATGFASVISTDAVPFLAISSPSNGTSFLQFEGLPGRAYQLQYADSLDHPVWQPLVTNNADQFGRFQYFDSLPPGTGARFYRCLVP